MKKKDLYFAAGVLVVIGIFVYLTYIGRTAKPVSDIPQHAGFTSKTEAETCWACHAPDAAVRPMPEHHPKRGRPPDKSSCFVCHKLPGAATVLLYPTLNSQAPGEERFIWPSLPRK